MHDLDPFISTRAAALIGFLLLTALQGERASATEHRANFEGRGPASVTTAREGGTEPIVPKVVHLETALEFAVLHNPDLAAAASRIRAAHGRSSDAGRRPNPTLGATAENWGGGLGSSRAELTVALFQVLELGGDRSARAATARAEAELALIDFTVEERELLGFVTEDFLAAWWAQERLTRIREAERIAAEAVLAAGERVKAGAAAPVERIRAEGNLALRQTEVRRAESEFDVARRALALDWGSAVAGFDSLALDQPDTAPPPPPGDLIPRLVRHPSRLRVEAELAAAGARIREAKASRVSDLEAGFGARRLNEREKTGFVGSVSVPLPLWSTRRGAVVAADAERSAVALHAQQVNRRLEAQLYSLCDRLRASVDAFVGVRDRVLPSVDDALRELRSGYRSGRLSYVDLLEGQRASLEARMAVLEAARDVWSARLALARLIGAAPEQTGTPGER